MAQDEPGDRCAGVVQAIWSGRRALSTVAWDDEFWMNRAGRGLTKRGAWDHFSVKGTKQTDLGRRLPSVRALQGGVPL
jgi:hypothetical protein